MENGRLDLAIRIATPVILAATVYLVLVVINLQNRVYILERGRGRDYVLYERLVQAMDERMEKILGGKAQPK